MRFFSQGCFIGHKTGGFEAFLDVVVDWKSNSHETEHFLEVLKPLEVQAEVGQLEYFYRPLNDSLSTSISSHFPEFDSFFIREAVIQLRSYLPKNGSRS